LRKKVIPILPAWRQRCAHFEEKIHDQRQESKDTALRIFPVLQRDSFVSQRTAYAADADKKAAVKPTTKADYVLTANQLRLLKANDASFNAVVEKVNRKAEIDELVTIPETEKIPVNIEKLTIEVGVVRLSSDDSLQRDSKNGDKRICNILLCSRA
jgi:hypothetical protein